jgi:hypothetical protein
MCGLETIRTLNDHDIQTRRASATDWHMRIPPMAQQHHHSGTC